MDKAEIQKSVDKLEKYILKEQFKGYDPFDGLMSPVFRLPLLRTNKYLRLGIQQLLKRNPINMRPILGIRKGLNPVTLGLCIEAFTYLSILFPKKEEFYKYNIDKLITELINLKSKGYSGACWGYDFDWEARYAKIPKYTPTIVATGFITNALFVNYKHTNNEKSFELCKSAVNFILNDLNRSYNDKDTFCFSYSPLDHQQVYNATMKGARLLAQVYSVNNDNNLKLLAANTVKFVVKNQNNDGSWCYSKGDSRKWVDNFHTGYILNCLYEYIKYSEEVKYNEILERGLLYYINNFFYKNEIPKYYNNDIYPIDTTSIAQSIITLTKFKRFELTSDIVSWAILNMQNKTGYFYYQKKKIGINRISYMRWSNSWMLLSLAYFLFKNENY